MPWINEGAQRSIDAGVQRIREQSVEARELRLLQALLVAKFSNEKEFNLAVENIALACKVPGDSLLYNMIIHSIRYSPEELLVLIQTEMIPARQQQVAKRVQKFVEVAQDFR